MSATFLAACTQRSADALEQAASPQEGDTVHFLAKGIPVSGIVRKRVEDRVRVEQSSGTTSWVGIMDLLDVLDAFGSYCN